MFNAVLFDLDGTLLDTLEDIADSMNGVLKRHGFPEHPLNSYRTFVGDGVRMLAQRTLPDSEHKPERLDAFVREFRDAYAANWNNKTHPYDGITDMLDALTERGLRMSVLSNKPDDFTKQCMDAHFSKWDFEIVQGALPDVPNKPHPDGAAKIAATMNIPPQRFLYVGDTATDMETAVRAGMYPAGALWGFRSRLELESSGARTILPHATGVVALIDARSE